MAAPFVVVGGDAAGLSAASKCLREDPDRQVVVFERGRWISYAHCGTPYYVKGEVDRLTDLLSLSPEEAEERGIDLRRSHEVIDADPDDRTVTVRGPDGEFEQPFSDLLVATGASALRSPVAGTDLDGVFTLHGLDDAAAIRAFLEPPGSYDARESGGSMVDAERAERFAAMEPPESVAVVGGGYVGVEMAEALTAQGVAVHLFQRGDRVLPMFGPSVGETVADHLREQGVRVHTGAEVAGLAGDGRVEGITYRTGDEEAEDEDDDGAESLAVEGAVVGVGIRPNTAVAEAVGADLGESGAVAVDDYGETSVDGVYAAGDCAESTHTVTGAQTWDPLGLPANRAGRAIGSTVGGTPEPVGEVAGTAVVKAFDLGCGRAGLFEEAAREAGFDPVTRTITGRSRSGYYPGAADLEVTLVADRESGRLLGGSTAGTDRAAKHVDTLATALHAGMDLAAFERLDLAYAPPFSPVWDPLLTCAKVLRGDLA